MKRFVDEVVSVKDRFSLGRDTITGEKYLSIPVANRMVDYEEYYKLELSVYNEFVRSNHAAVTFANECRRREHDDCLVVQPGTDRGTAI
ncbi:hypothetical protein [Sphingomonas sp. Leaf242]|uniref:hypothetical protein n=1 Tax=Sphingomonas sp. Leaf242 TaxID=1736304 RepID=UPI0009E86BCF|nr:hypothetical protein [Sphingomonas sp. Leaf242]